MPPPSLFIMHCLGHNASLALVVIITSCHFAAGSCPEVVELDGFFLQFGRLHFKASLGCIPPGASGRRANLPRQSPAVRFFFS
jgi:hypothetical protein